MTMLHRSAGKENHCGDVSVDTLPDECPFCHKIISPDYRSHYVENGRNYIEVLFQCPNEKCKNHFIGYYQNESQYPNQTRYVLKTTTSGNVSKRNFSDEINSISNDFEAIYNQASSAEQMNFDKICGCGYRKALEFLIKDYCIHQNPDKAEAIKKTQLGKVIESFVTDSKVKSVTKKATWLGNDETHYVKKWEDKDLKDLKKLIELSIHWIEAELLTASFEEDMGE